MRSKKIKQTKLPTCRLSPYEIAPILKGLLTEKDNSFIINYRLNKDIRYFMNGANVSKL